ncbi:sporulation delaying protein family toxin [Actinomadura bangladeshensis]|uniref:Sporulation delaying protein family toxin n=1 Tax=Actinomadura bangladeshensis TaxID=453573 RepID=A0A4R4PC63_9ACTN|nr:sporulation delaying protein family toxin [Actinomadura bangladeshensis]TDC20035.1 sporulation delaying protein family toxin [Actinomadura bangladeshensis]
MQTAKLRRSHLASALAIATSVTVLAGAAPAIASPDQAARPATVQTARFSGEDLFRGLFFGQGPVATTFPDITHQQQARVRTDVVNELVSLMSESDPAFFSRFAADIRSGDRYRIRSALFTAHDLADSSARAAAGRTATAGSTTAKGPCGWTACADVVAAAEVAIVVIAAAVAVVEVAVQTPDSAFQEGASSGSQPLALDIWVNAIAKDLRA